MSLLRRLPPFSTVMVALVLVFLYAPIAIVVVNSFNSNETLVSWGGFTLEWYEQAFGNERVRRDLETSLLIAAVSTGFALLIAVSASLWFRGAGGRGQRILDGTTYMRIILPEVVLAFGLFILLNRFEVTLGIWTVVIGHVTVYSAYATVVIQARLASLSRTLEEAAQDLGAPPRRVFRRVTLPLMMPGVLVAGLLVFTFSFDNVVLSRFLGGAEAETLPVLVLGMIRRNVTPEVNAIGVGIMLVMFVTVALAALVAALRPSPGGSRILGVETTRKEEDS